MPAEGPFLLKLMVMMGGLMCVYLVCRFQPVQGEVISRIMPALAPTPACVFGQLAGHLH